jgi:hypothetical protein
LTWMRRAAQSAPYRRSEPEVKGPPRRCYRSCFRRAARAHTRKDQPTPNTGEASLEQHSLGSTQRATHRLRGLACAHAFRTFTPVRTPTGARQSAPLTAHEGGAMNPFYRRLRDCAAPFKQFCALIGHAFDGLAIAYPFAHVASRARELSVRSDATAIESKTTLRHPAHDPR